MSGPVPQLSFVNSVLPTLFTTATSRRLLLIAWPPPMFPTEATSRGSIWATKGGRAYPWIWTKYVWLCLSVPMQISWGCYLLSCKLVESLVILANLTISYNPTSVPVWLCLSVPMQITLGVLFIAMQVSWIIGYFGKFDYFIQPHKCSCILSAHNLFLPAWYIDSYLYWDVKLVPSP